MSSRGAAASSSGSAAASSADGGSGASNDTMKRAAVKNLIERYFRQLTEGCGNPSCGNPNCFSSGVVETMSRDQAAAAALQLFKTKGSLCPSNGADASASPDHHAFKIPRSSPPPSSTLGPNAASASSSSDAVATTGAMASSTTSSTSSSFREDLRPATNVITVATTSQHQIPAAAAAAESGSASASKKSSGSTIATGGAKTKKSSKLSPVSTTSSTASTSAPKVVATLDEEKLLEILQICAASDNYSPLIRTLGETFNNPESLVASFRKKISVEHLSKEDRSALEADKDKDTDELMETEDVVQGTTTSVTAATIPGGADDVAMDQSSSSMVAVMPEGVSGPSTSTAGSADLGLLAAAESALSDDQLSLDLDSLRRCYKALFEDNKVKFVD